MRTTIVMVYLAGTLSAASRTAAADAPLTLRPSEVATIAANLRCKKLAESFSTGNEVLTKVDLIALRQCVERELASRFLPDNPSSSTLPGAPTKNPIKFDGQLGTVGPVELNPIPYTPLLEYKVPGLDRGSAASGAASERTSPAKKRIQF